MDQVMAVFAWFKANAVQLGMALTSIIGAASIIVKLTPTQKDDTILAKIMAILSKFIALNDTKHQ